MTGGRYQYFAEHVAPRVCRIDDRFEWIHPGVMTFRSAALLENELVQCTPYWDDADGIRMVTMADDTWSALVPWTVSPLPGSSANDFIKVVDAFVRGMIFQRQLDPH